METVMYGANGWQCFFFFPSFHLRIVASSVFARVEIPAYWHREETARFFLRPFPLRERVFVGTPKPWRIAAYPV